MAQVKELDFSKDTIPQEKVIEVDKRTAIEISTYQPNYAGAKLKYGNVTKEYILAIAGHSYQLAGQTVQLPSKELVKQDLDNFIFYNAIYRNYTDPFETQLGEKFYEELTPEFEKFLATKNITVTYFRPKRKDLRPRLQNMFIETPHLDVILYTLGFDFSEERRLLLRTGKTLAERSPDIIIRSQKYPYRGYKTNVIVGRLRDDYKHKNIYSDDWHKSSEGILKVDPKDPTKFFDLSELDFDVDIDEVMGD